MESEDGYLELLKGRCAALRVPGGRARREGRSGKLGAWGWGWHGGCEGALAAVDVTMRGR